MQKLTGGAWSKSVSNHRTKNCWSSYFRQRFRSMRVDGFIEKLKENPGPIGTGV